MVTYLFKRTGTEGRGRGDSEVHRSPVRVYVSQPVQHFTFKDNLQLKRTKYVLLP
jgi:hypothetical protein